MELAIAASAPWLLVGIAWICGAPTAALDRTLPTRSECVALRLLFGFGLLGTMLFLVGQVCYTPAVAQVVLLSGALAFFRRGFRDDLVTLVRPLRRRWTGLLTTAILGLLFTAGLCEPLGNIGHDGISYHLLGPKVWLRQGRIDIVLDHFHTTFPAVIEVLFGVLLGAAGPRSIGSFGAVLFLLLLVQVFSLGASMAGPRSARLAMAAVATMPAVVLQGGVIRAFVDIPFAAFSLAAVRLALAGEGKTPLILGAFLGFAAGTKYTGLFVIAATLAVLLLQRGPRMIRAQSTPVACTGIVAAAVAAPWYLRNLIVLGSPIYPPPILRSIFVARWMPTESVDAFISYIHDRGKGMGKSFLSFLLLPFNLAFFPAKFHGAGGIGLIPTAFAPLGFATRWGNRKLLTLALWALSLTAAWFLTQQEARFLIHVFAVTAILGALGAVGSLGSGFRLLRILAVAVVTLSMSYGAAIIALDLCDPLRAVVSPQFAESYRRQVVPCVSAVDYLARVQNGKVVLVIDPAFPSYYLDGPYLKPLDPFGLRVFNDIVTRRDAVLAARRLGAAYLLDTDCVSETRGGGHPDFAVMESDGFTLEVADDYARIYRVD